MIEADYFERKINDILLAERISYIRIFDKLPINFTIEVSLMDRYSDVKLEDILEFENFKMLIFSLK